MFLAGGAIALFLSVMGVLLASRGDMSDPVGGVAPFVPEWLYIVYILLVQDFTTVLHHFVALLVVWLGPFAAVWMTDGLMRRWRYEPAEVHGVGPAGAYWGWHGINARGWIA